MSNPIAGHSSRITTNHKASEAGCHQTSRNTRLDRVDHHRQPLRTSPRSIIFVPRVKYRRRFTPQSSIPKKTNLCKADPKLQSELRSLVHGSRSLAEVQRHFSQKLSFPTCPTKRRGLLTLYDDQDKSQRRGCSSSQDREWDPFGGLEKSRITLLDLWEEATSVKFASGYANYLLDNKENNRGVMEFARVGTRFQEKPW